MILVTLVCCYAACWGPTKTRGLADVHEYILERTSEDQSNLFKVGSVEKTAGKIDLLPFDPMTVAEPPRRFHFNRADRAIG